MTDIVFLEPNKIDAVPLQQQQVYVIEKETNFCKIGVSSNFACRKRTIETQGGFTAINSFSSVKINNGYSVESAVHENLADCRKIGEWFNISFEQAVGVVAKTVTKIGEHEIVYHKLKPILLWGSPDDFTAWFLIDSPELYDWFVANKYTLYYCDITNSILIHSELDEFEDMPFELFSKIMIHTNKRD